MKSIVLAALVAALVVLPSGADAQSVAQSQLQAPTNLTATLISPTQVRLSWSGSVTGNGTWRIERAEDGTTFIEIGSTNRDTKTFIDSPAPDDAALTYRVRAQKGTDYSGYSNVASVLTPPANNWTNRGGNPQQTGKNSLESGVPPLTSAWNVDLNPPNPYFFFATSPLVVENGLVYVTNSPNSSPPYPSMLWALDLATGQIRWTHDFGFVNLGVPSVRHGRVFVGHDLGGGTNAQLDAFNAVTGALLWTVPTGQAISEVLPAGPGNAYAISGIGGIGGGGGGIGGSATGTLTAYNVVNGQQRFANTTLEGPGAPPAYQNGAVYAYTGGKVREIDAATGASRWEVTIAPTLPSGGNGTPVLGGGLVYVIYQNAVYAVNPVTRTLAWTQSGFLISTQTPAYADGVLYVNNSGAILGLDAATGAPVWSFTDNLQIDFPPVAANNHLYLSTQDDLYAVDLKTHQTVFHSQDWGGPIAVAQGKLLISRRTGTVSAFTLSPGTLPNQSSVPLAPQSLSATPRGTGAVQLTWTDAANNETGVRVERSTDGGATYKVRTILGAGAVGFLDSGLSAGSYKFRVKAFNDAGTSAASNAVTFTPPAPGNAWNMLGGNPAHTGVNLKETGAPPVTLLWSWSSGVSDPYFNPVAVEDHRVFSTGFDGSSPSMNALDVHTGALLWTQGFQRGGNRYGPPTVVNGRVYYSWLNNPGSKFMCAEASTGKLLWGNGMISDGYYSPTQATVLGGTAYVTGGVYGQSWLLSMSADDGHQQWVNPSAYLPSAQGGALYTHWGDAFRSLDPATGNTVWSTALPNGSIPTLTATRGYGVTNRDLYAIDLATHAVVGTVLSANLNNFYTEPTIFNSNVYWVSDGALQVRRESNLSLLWSFAGDSEIRTRPIIANGYVIVSSLTNTYILNTRNRALVKTIASAGTPVVADGVLFIAGLDGVLSAYQLH